MPFSLDSFASLRPYTFHLTSAENLDLICRLRRLKCAAEFIKNSGQESLLRSRRIGSSLLSSGRESIRLQSQSPLYAGNIAFDPTWNLGDFIECLNEHVFFWPGTRDDPIKYGRNHFNSRWWSETPVALRMRTSKLFELNATGGPLFCRFNSGAPRCINGRKSPRGSSTFMPADRFEGTASQVVEVVFPSSAHLPNSTEFGTSLRGPWLPLFGIQ